MANHLIKGYLLTYLLTYSSHTNKCHLNSNNRNIVAFCASALNLKLYLRSTMTWCSDI